MVDMLHVIHSVPKVPDNVPKENRIDWVTENLNRFCVLPWINLNTNPNGDLKLCCSISLDHFVNTMEGPNSKILNLGYDDIGAIWNGPYLDNVRNLHRQNNGSPECYECFKMEKVTGHSPRKGQNVVWVNRKKEDKELSDYFTKVSSENLYSFADQLPVSLELRLGNQCNLKCVSCWGMSSSLIQEERKSILGSGILKENKLEWLHERWEDEVKNVDQADVKEWYETETFYNNFKMMAPKLRRLYTTGGEPTLIKANYRMLEELIAADNTSCRVEFTSNMAAWNPKFYEALSKFDNVEIQMSIDGIGSLAEYVRYGSEWSKVKENVNRVVAMAATKPNWRVVCYTVLQAMNYQHMTNIWQFLGEVCRDNRKRIFWWPITLTHPPHLSLAAVPLEERQTAIPKIKEEFRKYTGEESSVTTTTFQVGTDALKALTDSILNTNFDESLNKRFTTYKNFLDMYRSTQNGS